jgi:hypothetical protein
VTDQYLLTLDPGREISPEERRRLKSALGDAARLVLHDAPVSIDHLGVPITDIHQAPRAV